ncbi:protein LEO1 homolog [Larimichthys crocea]|uniref:protein LEO1 homolog n=1 Tax=Larimichthys crocea TaxID=215358 RepID=UPI000F5E018A|nr:protein LEO1 homolog [Larimichthys crocea]
MRPTTSTMLQQNNNNNYPCLNMSGSTREMLQKCSRASLPFPSRLELGLGDLPLIRGLRAWALCSKNRRKASGMLGGGQAPTAPPAGRGGPTSCPRPADVYLSGEWGRMGYGLPLGLDAGQAGIGALVTVATLKTSEGSGKTQTQCLFLRTEKGSCLYSTAKPGPGATTSAASSVVGGWLRGKTGGGSKDTPAGRRDHGPTPLAQTGANRVRVRSGRRWRKSCNAAGREKTGASRERQQSSSREDPAGERQEERDKGGLDLKQFPSPQQDIRKAKQEKDGAFRSPRCCHNASPKTCTHCGRRAQRRESQDEHEGGESPRRGVPNKLNGEVKGMKKERQKNEEEEKGGLSGLESVPNPVLESNHFHPESHSSRDVEETREAESKPQTSHSKDSSEKEEDTNTDPHSDQVTDDFISRHNGESDDRKPSENPCEDTAAHVNGFFEAHQESEGAVESVDVEEEEGSVNQTPADLSVVSTRCEDASISAAVPPEPSTPVEGSTCDAGNSKEVHLEDVSRFEQREPDENITVNELEERDASSSPLRHADPSIFETDGRITQTGCNEVVWENREDESQEEIRVNPREGGEVWRRECIELEDEQQTKTDTNDSTTQEGGNQEVTQSCARADDWRLQESAGGCRGRKEEDGVTCEQTRITHIEANGETGTSVTNVACADPSTSFLPSLANPTPSLPPLGSMATGLPSLEAEKEKEEEEEEEGVRVTAGDGEGGQEGKRRELEEQDEEERGSTVATEDVRKEEEEDEFGVFMQAEGEPAWSEESTMSASVPCGSRESVALGNHAIAGESTHWTPGWTDSSFNQSDDTWTAFPQDSSDERRGVAGQWWPTNAVEESRDRLASVFAEAFPSLPGSSSCDLDTVPTLTQLLRGKASQDHGLLDSFHDLNKMICQRYKRANGASRDLLLKTLHLEQPHTESRSALRTANRRLSPGLPSANQHAQNAAAKRRLSYDYNRNTME